MTQIKYIDNGVKLTDVFKVKELYIKEIMGSSDDLELKFDSSIENDISKKLRNVHEFLLIFKMKCNSTFGIFVCPSTQSNNQNEKEITLFPIFSVTHFDLKTFNATFTNDINNKCLKFTIFDYNFGNGVSQIHVDQQYNTFFSDVFFSYDVAQVQMYRLVKP